CASPAPAHRRLRTRHPYPTRRSSDLATCATKALPVIGGWRASIWIIWEPGGWVRNRLPCRSAPDSPASKSPWWPEMSSTRMVIRSEEHTSELQSRENLVCRLLLEKKN